MWSSFRCVNEVRVLPWTGHACDCAGLATLRCLGWVPSEGGLSPARKSCQQQIRRECLVMITTQTQTHFSFCPGLSWQERWSTQLHAGVNPTGRVHGRWLAGSLPPSLLQEKCGAEAAFLKHDKPVSPHGSQTRIWYLDLGCRLD